MRRLAWLLLLSSGCATARLVGDPPAVPPDPRQPKTVVLEPLFEAADWQTSTRTEYATLMGQSYGQPGASTSLSYSPTSAMGGPGTTNVAITREVSEKPLFARVPTLNEVHQQLASAVSALRPSWRITSTSGASALSGQVHVIRTIIEGNEVVGSDRTLKNLAFAFGLVILPLQLLAMQPVEETVRVQGVLERFDADASALPSRLVRYPTQPDFAVNLAGLTPLRHAFGLDLTYEEGLLANESPRTSVLIGGFVQRLAAAVVAIVEETPGQSPPPAPKPADGR